MADGNIKRMLQDQSIYLGVFKWQNENKSFRLNYEVMPLRYVQLKVE